MTIKIFLDGADLATMLAAVVDPRISGFTTNPTLARKAGVGNYREFGKRALAAAGAKPVSIEVLADEFSEMRTQAYQIASWGDNAWVKIPVTNTRGEASAPLIRHLAAGGVQLNVTAVFTERQVLDVGEALSESSSPAIVSVFAGRVADAGVDPFSHVALCRHRLRMSCPRAEMLWASPRQAYDAVLAERAGCEVITMSADLISKLALAGKDLTDYSRETVEMFYHDARAAGFEL